MGGSGHSNGGNYQENQNEQIPQIQENSSNYLNQNQSQFQPQNVQIGQNQDKCFDFSNLFSDCMKFNFNNSTICQQAFDDLKKCQNGI